MTTLFLDLETFSHIPLKKAGAYRYSEDCEILLVAWAFDDDPVTVWDMTTGEHTLADVQRLIDDADEVVIHNSMFDRVVLRAHGVDVPAEKIEDTMVLALQHSLPGSLDMLCDVLRVPFDKAKDKDGKKLINLFCKPRPKNVKLRRATGETHPDEWQRFTEYARLDVDAMREVRKRVPRWNDTDSERGLWLLDQITNDRGVKGDIELAHAAIRAFRRTSGSLAAAASDATGGVVTSTTQVAKLAKHLLETHGFEIADMTKGSVSSALDEPDLDADVRALLQIRQQASAASPAKYTAVINSAGRDGRIRGTIQFCGASRTGRAAGRIVQVQNLPRPTMSNARIETGIEALKSDCEDLLFDNVSDLCVNTVRGLFIADRGNKLVVADLSNIEGRVLAWLAGEEWKLKAFRDFDTGAGHDLYKLAYARSYTMDAADVTKDQRQIGKVMELALGYQGSVGAFSTMGANYGVALPESTVLSIVKAWRAAHPATKRLWYAAETAARSAIENPGECFMLEALSFDCRMDDFGMEWLRMRLPSGRYLCYPRPEVRKSICPTCDGAGTVQWEGVEHKCFDCGGSGASGRSNITYEGLNQYTRKWKRLDTYGGKFVENATQAVARDIFMHGLRAACANNYNVVMQVHDELVCEVPDDDRYTSKTLAMLMAERPSWAVGLPLAAAGFETHRYRKD